MVLLFVWSANITKDQAVNWYFITDDNSRTYLRDLLPPYTHPVKLHIVNPELISISSIDVLLLELKNRVQTDSTDKLFIMLQPPYSKNKKILRREIEDVFLGSSRAKALALTVPIYNLNQYQHEELCKRIDDDMVYSKDNYGGFGVIADKIEPVVINILKTCKFTSLKQDQLQPTVNRS